MPETLPLEELIKKAIRTEIARVHTQVPGRVISYDGSNNTAKIQLIVEHSRLDPDTDERIYYKPAPLVNVPVVFPAILTWPIESGDAGWVQFAERSIDEYQAAGRDDVQPADTRRFDLSDAVFYPTFMRGEFDSDPNAAVLSSDDLKVRSSPNAVTRPVAIAPEVAQFLINFITTEVLPHIHSDPLTGSTGPSPGPFTPPSLTEFDAGNVEAE